MNAVTRHVDDEDKGVTEMMTPGGTQKITIINESGLYSLVLSSKLPAAKKFKRWVTSEVLFPVPFLCHFCAVKGPQWRTQLHTENKEKPHCKAIFGLTMRF